jgi:GT2 family glycosyltransferase
MNVSVIIPVMDDPRVRDVVSAVAPQLSLGDEILVADDGTPGALPPLPEARIVAVHGRNQAHARNQAARQAGGDVLLFLDADVVVPPGWLATAKRVFTDPDVMAAQGFSRATGSEHFLARRMQEEYERFVASHAATGYADMCDTRCFGIRRDVFQRFLFDIEEPTCEDGVLGRRLFEAHIPIRFVPEWTVGHHYTRSIPRELARLHGYAAASAKHLDRTGRDLFRSPGATPPRGPGAAVLRVTRRFPALGVPLSRLLWLTALGIGAGAAVPQPLGARFFSRARRAAVLSARVAAPHAANRQPHA